MPLWSRPMKWFGALALAALALLPTHPARADSATAEALFQSGREALESGDFGLACERFEESYRLDPTAGTALNLGNCREKLGQVASAWQRFREAADKLPSGDSRIAVATARAAMLADKIPKLTLRAPKGSQDWQIFRDGVAFGAAGLNLPLPLDPGSHVVEVRAPNRQPWRKQVDLEQSEQLELELRAGAPLPVDSERSPLASPSRGSRRVWGYVLGGVGTAGIATSLVTGAFVLGKRSTVNAECVDKRCSNEGLDAADSGRRLSTVSTVAFAAGAALVGAGIYLVLSAPAQSSPEGSRSSFAFGAGTRLEATTSPGGARLTLRTRF